MSVSTSSATFFSFFNAPPVLGRYFSASEDLPPNVLCRGKDPIGQCVRVAGDTVPCTYVVGIAENIKSNSLSDEPSYFYYLSAAQGLYSVLFDESPRDPAIYAIVTLVLLAVAIAASMIPARRAARVDPNVALRSE